ncbi:MAG: ATP-binding cassette domain-containing protein [Nitrospiraceae bacterium]|nr:ATP-binding cassette domain-containing protein [Nitrospiraceae bacterium]
MSLGMEATKVAKTYNGNSVLRDCSYSFRPPGVYILTGPNGCGKSTFLRIAALIEQPDSGTIGFFSDDKRVDADLRLKRKITLVLPKVGVFNTSVFKNVAYGLTIRGIGKQETEEKVKKVLEFVQLSHKTRQNALTLSSGETQRLGIARALVMGPDILFLDEPTASVDQKNSRIIEEILLKMKQESGPTVIMTTHDQSQAKRLADTLLVIRDGVLAAEKGPK